MGETAASADFIEKEILAHRELGGAKTLAGRCASTYNEKLRDQVKIANDVYASFTKPMHESLARTTAALDERRDSYNYDKHYRKNYLTTQPAHTRKYGFGTSDASRRDEFMTNVASRQHKEKVRSEADLQGVPIAANAAQLLDETLVIEGKKAEKQDRPSAGGKPPTDN